MMRVPVFLSFFILLQLQAFGQFTHSNCNELFYDSFEHNLDQWAHVGKDCQRTKDYSTSGVYGLELRDNTDLNSSISTKPLQLSKYNKVALHFQYKAQSIEDREYFLIEVSTDNGENFKEQERWIHGDDFENDVLKTVSIDLDLNFTDATIFRFKAEASNNHDQIFIDEFLITDCPNFDGIEISSLDNNTIIDIVTVDNENEGEVLSLHRDPVQDRFTLMMEALQGQSGSVEIYNKTGAKLSRSIFKYDHDGKLSFPIDYLENGNYSVCVKSSNDKLFVLRLVVGS